MVLPAPRRAALHGAKQANVAPDDGYLSSLNAVYEWCTVGPMKRLPRMTVSLTEPQLAFLKEEAERLGISVGDLIRRIVDQYRKAQKR